MNSDRQSVADAAIDEVTEYVQGIRPNIGQFAQQLLQVFFVGLTMACNETSFRRWPRLNLAYLPVPSHS